MSVNEEVTMVSHGAEGHRLDVRLERFRENEEELVSMDDSTEVEYQPKGYLKLLKNMLERRI
jgi:hypothetical protein